LNALLWYKIRLLLGGFHRHFEKVTTPFAAQERLAGLFSMQEFLHCCSVSVPELERAWAKKKGLPAGQAKESFKRSSGCS
jgi:hypothetical protein